MVRLASVLAAIWLAAVADAGTSAGPPAPTVSGPRRTTSQEPTFVFRSPGATRFVCAFDSTPLHGCPSSFSEWLTVGSHRLRVQAVNRAGSSRVVQVPVRVVSPSGLYAAARIKVGDGAGVPAVDARAVWVPNTRAGTLSRVDAVTGRVVATIKLGTPPRVQGYLDAAVAAGGSIWVARDAGGEVDRIDPATNRIAARIKVESRPGGLAMGGGYVWAFHFEGNTVTRIDAATGAKKAFTVAGALGTGIAYAGGAAWLLTEKPSLLIKLDPETGDVQAKVPVDPRAPAKHGLVDTWWVAAGGGSLWVVNANYDRVTRVDAARAKVVTSIAVPVEIPFGAVVGKGAVWVAGAGKVVRIDPATNRVIGTVTLSVRSAPVFTQVSFGPAGLWATDYDAGRLYRLHAP
jgi:sugar lactone lactonase YvrE